MIKVPLADIITKIKEETKLSDEDIGKRIDEKLEQLSGLVSKEGAAHIIANELGIKVLEHVAGRLQIKNILAGMRDVETVGKVMRVFEENKVVFQDIDLFDVDPIKIRCKACPRTYFELFAVNV